MRLLLLVLSLITFGCRAPRVERPAACVREFTTTLHGDPAFTDSERIEISKAAARWAIFSNGRVRISVRYDAPPNLVREAEDSPAVTVADQSNRKPYSHVLGWALGMTVHLVPSRIAASHTPVKIVAMHEFGHLAGLKWPGCSTGPADDCDHSADENAIMHAVVDGQKDFNTSDLEFCRASCLCP